MLSSGNSVLSPGWTPTAVTPTATKDNTPVPTTALVDTTPAIPTTPRRMPILARDVAIAEGRMVVVCLKLVV